MTESPETQPTGTYRDPTSQPGLGEALGRVRRQRGLSLSAVSAGTGISTSFLSVVEKGSSDITMGRLVALLRFYGVRLNDLFPEIVGEDSSVVTPEERMPLAPPGPGVELYLLSRGTSDHSMMPVYAVHPPGSRVSELSGHPGETFLYALEGTLLFERQGHHPFVLGPGSAAIIRGFPPPTVTTISDVPAKLLAVLSPPSL